MSFAGPSWEGGESIEKTASSRGNKFIGQESVSNVCRILEGLEIQELNHSCLQEMGIITEMTVYLSTKIEVTEKREIGAILTLFL